MHSEAATAERPAPAVAPAIGGNALIRSGFLALGLFVFSLGIVLLLESGLGLSPWDVLNQGISEHTPLSFGGANIAVGLAVIVVAWRLGSRIGVGTVANAVLIGVFVDALVRVPAIEDLAGAPLAVRAGLLLAGIAAIAAGSALYIGAAMGAGPRDSLMLSLAGRTRVRIGAVRAAIEACVTAAGLALGGTVGIGTLAFALGIGPAIELAFSLLRRSPLAARAG